MPFGRGFNNFFDIKDFEWSVSYHFSVQDIDNSIFPHLGPLNNPWRNFVDWSHPLLFGWLPFGDGHNP
jgi:hypothetical protein